LLHPIMHDQCFKADLPGMRPWTAPRLKGA
jgi:hypothetical protein